jgi:hypothetical protein
LTYNEAIAIAWRALRPRAERTAAAYEFIRDSIKTNSANAVAGLRRLAELALQDNALDEIKDAVLSGGFDRLGLRVRVADGVYAGKTLTVDVGWRAWYAAQSGRMKSDDVAMLASCGFDVMDVKIAGDPDGYVTKENRIGYSILIPETAAPAPERIAPIATLPAPKRQKKQGGLW